MAFDAITAVMKERLQKSLNYAVIASEGMHIFCCVFPTLFSLLGLLAGLGLVTALPPAMIGFHDFMHHWEVPMIVTSGIIQALGWAVVVYSQKVDCHSTGCAHGACAPRKNTAHKVLKIATVLFIVNVVIYFGVHRSHWFETGVGAALMHTEEGHDHGHDHGDNAHGAEEAPAQP